MRFLVTMKSISKEATMTKGNPSSLTMKYGEGLQSKSIIRFINVLTHSRNTSRVHKDDAFVPHSLMIINFFNHYLNFFCDSMGAFRQQFFTSSSSTFIEILFSARNRFFARNNARSASKSLKSKIIIALGD